MPMNANNSEQNLHGLSISYGKELVLTLVKRDTISKEFHGNIVHT